MKTKNPSISYKQKSLKTRMKAHEVFLDAALVFEVGGDYKAIFKKAKNQTQGSNKKMYEVMCTATVEQMDRFCSDLVRNRSFIIES